MVMVSVSRRLGMERGVGAYLAHRRNTTTRDELAEMDPESIIGHACTLGTRGFT
jgi:hypothetical protein